MPRSLRGSDEVEAGLGVHRSYRGSVARKERCAGVILSIPLDRGDLKLPMICSPVTAARGEDYKTPLCLRPLKHTR